MTQSRTGAKRRPKVLGVGSPKGGVGKTQSAVELAAQAAEQGYKVLLLDADENRSAYNWSVRAGDYMPFDVDVVGGFAQALARLREIDEYDLMIIDLPGARTSDAWKALLHGADGSPVVDALLVPSAVRVMDLRPVVEVIRSVIIPAKIPYLLVGTFVRTEALHLALNDLTEISTTGISVARSIIRDLVVHSQAVAADRPVSAMPGGRRSTARAAEREYRLLGHEVFKGLLAMKWPDIDEPAASQEGANT